MFFCGGDYLIQILPRDLLRLVLLIIRRYKTGICFKRCFSPNIMAKFRCFCMFPPEIIGKNPTHFADVPSSPSILK